MEEKQIEVMSYSVCRLENKPKDCASCMWKATCNEYLSAESYYNAGYRKQSEGEWVWKKKIEPQAQNRLYCSVCDKECLSKNNYYVKPNYCPNCGARMKGE